MKIKIISDGTIEGSRVVDEDSLDEIENVTAFFINADAARGRITVNLVVSDVPLEMIHLDAERGLKE